jgi:hypothetical protein
LKTKDQTLSLKKLGELSFNLTIEEILQGIFRAGSYEFELKILPREDMAKNLSNELCEDDTKPSDKKLMSMIFFCSPIAQRLKYSLYKETKIRRN